MTPHPGPCPAAETHPPKISTCLPRAPGGRVKEVRSEKKASCVFKGALPSCTPRKANSSYQEVPCSQHLSDGQGGKSRSTICWDADGNCHVAPEEVKTGTSHQSTCTRERGGHLLGPTFQRQGSGRDNRLLRYEQFTG